MGDQEGCSRICNGSLAPLLTFLLALPASPCISLSADGYVCPSRGFTLSLYCCNILFLLTCMLTAFEFLPLSTLPWHTIILYAVKLIFWLWTHSSASHVENTRKIGRCTAECNNSMRIFPDIFIRHIILFLSLLPLSFLFFCPFSSCVLCLKWWRCFCLYEIYHWVLNVSIQAISFN